MKVDLRRPRRFYGALRHHVVQCKLEFVALHAIDYRCVLTFLSASFCSVVGPGFYRLSTFTLLCFFCIFNKMFFAKTNSLNLKFVKTHFHLKRIKNHGVHFVHARSERRRMAFYAIKLVIRRCCRVAVALK